MGRIISQSNRSLTFSNACNPYRRVNAAYISTPNEPLVKQENLEKRFVIPANLFNAIDFSKMNIHEVKEDDSQMPKFIIGEKYALRTPGCDGFEGSEKIYELVGFDDEFGGIKIDSLIVKQISGDCDVIFTLSKNDCSYLNIEYQPGLQLLPKKMFWVHVKEEIPFDENNLATTPRSNIDNSVRFVVLKLSGFTDYHDGYVLSPSGKLIKEKQFMDSLKVISKEPIVYGNGNFIWQDKEPLKVSIIHPNDCLFNHGNFISSNDEIFILINLRRCWGIGGISHDDCFGVDPKYLDGTNPNDLFEISWDELGAYTVEEYEELKKKKEAAKAERIRKEEERRKKAIEEELRKKAEEASLKEKLIDRMKNFRLNEPQKLATPKFNSSIDTIAGLGKYIDDLDIYFKDIDNQIVSIGHSLEDTFKYLIR